MSVSSLKLLLFWLSYVLCMNVFAVEEERTPEALAQDVKRLTQAISEEPNNEHNAFDLAQSYRRLGQPQDAMRWYKARIDMGGEKEEIYFSKYTIGEIFEEMGFWDQALHWYLDAYEYAPERADPLLRIATHYRYEGKNHLAYLYAMQGKTIPYPKEDKCFTSYPAYDYLLDCELAIAAFYTPYKAEGFAAVHRLILNRKTPEYMIDHAYKTALFYIENLKTSRIIPIKIDLPLLFEGSDEHYHPLNPSIQKTVNGYHVICRTVNWSQSGGSNYRSRNPNDLTLRNKNYFLRYDANFQLLSQQEIIEELPREHHSWHCLGLEDCRLFETAEGYHWIFCTTFDTHPGVGGMSLCKMKDEPTTSGPIFVEALVPLQGPQPGRYEKNWLPFVKDGALYALYSCDPFTILKINRTTGACETIMSKPPNHHFAKFRGSAPPMPFDSGYLFLVHEVFFSGQNYYLHRFVYADQDLTITKVSKPFTVFHKGVEFCCGMTTNHANKECVIAMGNEDKEAFLVTVDLDTVRSMLEPLP